MLRLATFAFLGLSLFVLSAAAQKPSPNSVQAAAFTADSVILLDGKPVKQLSDLPPNTLLVEMQTKLVDGTVYEWDSQLGVYVPFLVQSYEVVLFSVRSR